MMLPRLEKGGRSRVRGPESVPLHMWLLWFAINGYLAYRVWAPAKAMMPAGEHVELGSEPKVPGPTSTRGKPRGSDLPVSYQPPRVPLPVAGSRNTVAAHRTPHLGDF